MERITHPSDVQSGAFTSAFTSAPEVHTEHTSPHTSAHVIEVEVLEESRIHHGEPFTVEELAHELNIASSTLRTRWFPWLLKVAPLELLRTDAGYTQLARSLFWSLASVNKSRKAREQWVSDAKAQYSREFMPNGVTPSGVSSELGGALALLRNQGNDMQSAADAQLLQLQQLIESQAQVEAEFDEAEIAAMRAAGAKRGVMRFQIEAEEEDAAYYQLRKLKTQARKQSKSGKL